MTSAWGKLLGEVVVPTGGWDFKWTDNSPRTATIPAATYDTYLHLMDALLDAIDAVVPLYTNDITVSSVGFTTVTIGDGTGDLQSITYATCSDALMTAMGFVETEMISDDAVTAAGQHTHCWYPGTITHNYSLYRGAGLAGGALWLPQDVAVRTKSGSGNARIVTPGMLPRTRALRFDLIDLDEARHPTRGVAALMETHLASKFYWYLDRTVGNVGSYGTAIDPWDDVDDDGDYYVVTLDGQPKLPVRAEHPRKFQVELVLNAEAT